MGNKRWIKQISPVDLTVDTFSFNHEVALLCLSWWILRGRSFGILFKEGLKLVVGTLYHSVACVLDQGTLVLAFRRRVGLVQRERF